jgi:phosphoribosylaminoimidazole-succinocarboxamide synthase
MPLAVLQSGSSRTWFPEPACILRVCSAFWPGRNPDFYVEMASNTAALFCQGGISFAMENVVTQTNLEGLKCIKQGKVRDIYDLGDSLLMVTTDRISAFDVVMPDPIPDKGKILNQISLFWFDRMQPIVENHVITADVEAYPDICHPYAEILAGRSMLVKKTQPLPIECVVRGYISGSGWKSYQTEGTVCGIGLPEGLVESQRLPEAIFTPSTKEDVGKHDINIDYEAAARLVGEKLAAQVRDLSLEIYRKGAALADEKGIIIADTKFEFGLADGNLILIDEVLTPDSSRFWPKASYRPGGPQKSYDKQYLRDYLLSIQWEKRPPAPNLPPDVIANTRQKYLDALIQLTGSGHGIQ